MPRRLLSICSLALLLTACTSEPAAEGEGGTGTETGEEAKFATLVVDVDGSDLCGAEFGGEIEFVARRVDCWDPSLPCTVAQDPPWLPGTIGDCSALVPGVTRWELEVSQTGRWEARLQAGGMLACFGLDGDARTNVSKYNLDDHTELVLTPAPVGECGEP